MLYQQNIEHSRTDRTQMDTLLAELAPVTKKLAARQLAGALLDLPSRQDDLAGIEALAAQLRKKFCQIVVVGSGGSGLCGKTLVQLAPSSAPRFHFLDNVDPHAMEDVLALDLKDTCFIIISKSGATVETISQCYVLLEQVEKSLGKNGVSERFVVITQPGESPLYKTAAQYGLPMLDHAPDIGGRFSILSNVGLLPAAIAGLDIRALRQGAQTVVEQMEQSASCLPAIGAALQYTAITRGLPMNVMWPYVEKLGAFAAWYRQCWAESLGKEGRGSTPIPAIGTSDQHSQLQLYLDGPRDKLFHLVILKRAGQGRAIPTTEHTELAYLKGKTLGDVMEAEQRATFETLVRHECPVRVITLEALTEASMGALLMHFMLEVIFTAALLDVDAFNQPAVEEGKKLAQKYLLRRTS